jgi:hypothetical protein
MARTPLNALQAILIRERLILYFKTKNSEQRIYSVRKLIEDIALSMANEGEARAYQENEDFRDEGRRSASGYTLKNSTVDNLLARRASAISDDNLRLIRNFLLAEGYLSSEALDLCGEHPDLRLRSEFSGIAPTDPRLQRHRRVLEGEYQDSERSQTLCIAAPGRSKPFVSLRAGTLPRAGNPLRGPAISASSERYEGRVFLMPGHAVSLVEMSTFDKVWDGAIYRVTANGDTLELQSDQRGSRSFSRTQLNVRRGIRAVIQEAIAKLRSRWQACRERDCRALSQLARMWAPSSPDTRRAALTYSDAELIEAAKSGHFYHLIELLAAGANINARDPATGRTAAHWAAASGSVQCVYALVFREDDEEQKLRKHFPDIDPDGEFAQRWRAARQRRDPLRTDDEGCFASALAPVSTDGSERNRAATECWLYLFLTEAEVVESTLRLPRSAFLEVWKPSSVMMEAFERYAAPLPAGFTDPKPD